MDRQNTPRRNVSGEVFLIFFAQLLGARRLRWALQPDGSSPSGAVSPSQIWSVVVRWPVARSEEIADFASERYSEAERWTATPPTTSYCGLSQEPRFGSFQIDQYLTVG